MCFVYVRSSVCVHACCYLSSTPCPSDSLAKLGVGGWLRGKREWRVKRWKKGRCLVGQRSRWEGWGEGGREGGKARLRWASPGDYLCFHVLLSFTCSPNSDCLAGWLSSQAYQNNSKEPQRPPPFISPDVDMHSRWLPLPTIFDYHSVCQNSSEQYRWKFKNLSSFWMFRLIPLSLLHILNTTFPVCRHAKQTHHFLISSMTVL